MGHEGGPAQPSAKGRRKYYYNTSTTTATTIIIIRDLGGTGGTVPQKNLRWGTAHASVPSIFGGANLVFHQLT